MDKNVVFLIKSVTMDIEGFEKNNDLTKDNSFFHQAERNGTFTISDGTEYEYSFNLGLSVHKKTTFIKFED